MGISFLHDAVAALPGSLAARELFVRRAMEYLDSLAADTGEDASLRQELALGYKRLGQLQGQEGLPNLGDRAAARRSFERAAALFESLDLPAMDVNAPVGAIDAYAGLALSDVDKTSRTIHLSKARTLIERLSREAPSDPRVLIAASVVWFHTGIDPRARVPAAGGMGARQAERRAATHQTRTRTGSPALRSADRIASTRQTLGTRSPRRRQTLGTVSIVVMPVASPPQARLFPIPHHHRRRRGQSFRRVVRPRA